MPENKVNNYEAMFLFSQSVATDFASVIEHVNEILRRAEAKVIAMKKWDERRLAYEIDKQKRGVFILVYFSAAPDRIAGIERDCNLSEKVLRVMVTRADHLTVEEMQAADAREELETEARLAAARADEKKDDTSAGVTLGAPVTETPKEEAPKEEAPKKEASAEKAATDKPADAEPAVAAEGE